MKWLLRSLRTPLTFLASLVLFSACGDTSKHLPATRGGRLALVIGNGAYENGIPKLPNPPHDAAAVAALLQRLGFDTLLVINADRSEMLTALRAFATRASTAEIVVVFYSGHAVEVDHGNILLPVDLSLSASEGLAEVRGRSLPLADVDAGLAGIDGIKLIFLDACRTNPFEGDEVGDRSVSGSAKKSRLDISQGLASEQPKYVSAIIYSTHPGSSARDGVGAFSPFTTAILQSISTEGLWLPQTLVSLRLSVTDATSGAQVPSWNETSNIPVLHISVNQSIGDQPRKITRMVTEAAPAQIGTVPALPSNKNPESVYQGVPVVWEPASYPSNFICDAHAGRGWTTSGGHGRIEVNRDGQACAVQIFGDPDRGFPASNLVVSGSPSHGRIVIEDNSFAYVPNSGYVGQDTFSIDALGVTRRGPARMHGVIDVIVR
jgi:hypothetical protein